jgi:uncharacterized Fe-S cluster-containing radical SAM superfamily protein
MEGPLHTLIASPFMGEYMVVRPGHRRGLTIPQAKYLQLAGAEVFPDWLVAAAQQAWGMDLAGVSTADRLLVRPETGYAFGKVTYELNLGCNYDCEHCYLGLKEFAGLDWPQRERLLETIRDAGVLWLQLTGGEPMVDRLFPAVYATAYEMGMMIEILTNGSRLAAPRILELLTTHRPSKLSISVYGATETSYDALVRRRGAFRAFLRGLEAAHEAGLLFDLSLIITNRLLLRQGGCTGCTLHSTCGTCMPLAQLYREAQAPLATYCQHGHPREEVKQ